ncbi:MAG: IS110 family RNA-guided transposase [Isosphaeraceae bacterium]
MSATHKLDPTMTRDRPLYLAFELGWTSWGLAFSTATAQPPRRITIPARDLDALRREIVRAKRRFGLSDDAPVRSCYEAGRDGFWLHRWLTSQSVSNLVVDASSIEINRRARRAKSDAIDVTKLLMMLMRYHLGERELWSVVNVPTLDDEDRRQPYRDRLQLVGERTEHSNRIKGLLATLGVDVLVDEELPGLLDQVRQWDGTTLPAELKGRLLREFERWVLVDKQIRDLGNRQHRDVRDDDAFAVDQVRRLLDLKGIGPVTAWLLVREIFGWRKITNRRELASLVGLDPSPYQSGELHREQGISKAGNKRVRWAMVELAWMWLRHQPGSELSLWYNRRFGSGNARARKVGIVALARKLLIALWKYLKDDEVPEGALLTSWEKKLNGRLPAARQAV